MPKSVKLATGLQFGSISEGIKHFTRMLEAHELQLSFTGEDAAHIRAAFEAYCVRTDWPLPSPPASFYPTRDRGPGYTTRCYGVTFENGTTERFSMAKALRAIAM